MCGICGFWSNSLGKDFVAENSDRMTESLKHRGPNGDGTINLDSNRLSFGHTRLSILDLSKSGRQPMTYRGQYTISYNGEIFNFIEIRKQLENLGHHFFSETDTEVILAAYAEWGVECLNKFNGMWAFAIWDAKEKLLLLTRDRYGIKPLYYSINSDKLFLFASETIAFHNITGFHPKRSENLLAKYIDDPELPEALGLTTYSNIRQVKPGCYLEVRENGRHIKEKKWWNQADHILDVPEKYEDQVEEFSSLLKDSCRIRLRSDVPIASAVSGGLDSSSIYTTLNHEGFSSHLHGEKRINSDFHKGYFVSFPDDYCDESKYANAVFNSTGKNYKSISHKIENLPDLIKSTTEHFDTIALTPLASISPLYDEMSKDGYKISIDGHGVDEMMFGYSSMVSELKSISQASGNENYAKHLNEVWVNTLGDPDKVSESENHTVPRSAKLRIKMGKWKRRIMSFGHNPQNQNSNAPPLSPPSDYRSFDPISQKYFFQSSLPTILRDFDRASMYHGIEIRMPFMDYRLVSYVLSLPTTSKIKNGFNKSILRDSMRGILPEKVRVRKWKVGISAPLANWFSNHEMKNFILDSVHSLSFQNASIWNGKLWEKKISKIQTKEDWIPYADQFWRVFNAYLLTNK